MSEREREREGERGREREGGRERDREREGGRERDRERERDLILKKKYFITILYIKPLFQTI